MTNLKVPLPPPKCIGVLCYALEPLTQNIYFLLGQEAFDNTWCDFAGGPKPNESIIDTAVREFSEESMNAVMEPEKIREDLEARRYSLMLHYDQRIVFLKQIPFDPTLPMRFAERRLEYLEEGAKPELVEKRSIEWFSLNRIEKMVRHDKNGVNNVGKLRRHFVITMQLLLDIMWTHR